MKSIKSIYEKVFNIFTHQENANKTTWDYYYIPIRMAKLQKLGIIKTEDLKQQKLIYATEIVN